MNTIELTRAGAVTTLTLNRPDKLNSFTRAMHLELRAALDAVQADRSVRALVLTGAGRGFCAGQDLADLKLESSAGMSSSAEEKAGDLLDVIHNHYNPLLAQLSNLRVPTIAAVNGVAAGAGASLAMACDITIAAKSASFVQAFSKIGLVPDTGGTWLLPQRLGQARALALALTGDKLSAEQAAAWGMIWQCVDDAELPASAAALAAKLAAMPTRALVATRKLMHGSSQRALTEQAAAECLVQTDLAMSADYNEGVAAFLAKRPAQFKGE
jgi:2-(1,2-epoxy-1,2-dihydrophenyl)acetyl-CoA isomerase